MSALPSNAAAAAAAFPNADAPVRAISNAKAPARDSRARWARRYRDRVRATDALIVVLAALGGVVTRLSVMGERAIAAEPTFLRVGIPALVVAVWLGALAAFRTRDTRIAGSGATEYRRVANASAAALGLLAVLLLLIGVPGVRWYLIVSFPVGALVLVLARWLWRKWLLAQRRYGHYLSRALVVGDRADVEYAVRQVEKNPAAGFDIVGIVSDDLPMGVVDFGDRAVPVLSTIDAAAKAARTNLVDSVIVTGNLGDDGQRIRRLGWDLEGSGAELVLSSRLADVAGPRIHFRPVEGLPLLHVEIPRFEGARHTTKRAFDMTFAAFALLLIAPILLAIAIAIRLDDGGPVFFSQERCGRDSKTFRMFKFRTMRVDAEHQLAALRAQNEADGPLFKIHDDPRVTRIGRLLRRHSLDELPQFWNVLLGDMSVVGPRPPLLSEAEAYDGVVSRRLMIKPGLTGLWQISGRSDLAWEESVRLDLYYVENWSLTGDLMIVWRTAKTVIGGEGAY